MKDIGSLFESYAHKNAIDKNLLSILYDNFNVINYHDNEKIAIYVEIKYGRFGNRYSSIKNLILFGLHCKIKKIFIKLNDIMFNFDNNKYIKCVKSKNEILDYSLITPKKGDEFFYYYDVNFENHPIHSNAIIYNTTKKILYHSLNCAKDIFLPDGSLVIHIRSGDIFSKNPNSSYAQPPLSWYKRCILSYIERHKENFIAILLFEDKKNPCIDLLINWCKDNKFTLFIRSGDIRLDYSYIMNTNALIASYGTFLYPAFDLNDKLRIVYRFSFDKCKPGAYFKPGEWIRSDDQIQKMIFISEDDLQLPQNLYEQSNINNSNNMQLCDITAYMKNKCKNNNFI
jgi:hypothetical protein